MELNEEKLKKTSFPVLLIITGLAIAAGFIFLFAEIAEEVMEQEVKSFDGVIIGFLKSIESPALDHLLMFITELGSVWFLTTLSILTVVYLWFKAKNKWGVLFFIIGVGGGGLLTFLLKHYYQRGRPSINPDIDAVGFSFPSGHSMGSLIYYGFLIYFIIRSGVKKEVKWTASLFAVIIVILIGLSRIYLGAHFPSDVIAGHIAGSIWLLLCVLALEWVVWQSSNSIRPIKAVRKFFEQRSHA
ncbi:phosphatase PAP2 family protein [Bacillus infantis]|uniref:phosphatase PAP2 family protein n=1 Tax=Bacillus infantis TaxID=324767 RepID=UPI003CF7AE5B